MPRKKSGDDIRMMDCLDDYLFSSSVVHWLLSSPEIAASKTREAQLINSRLQELLDCPIYSSRATKPRRKHFNRPA